MLQKGSFSQQCGMSETCQNCERSAKEFCHNQVVDPVWGKAGGTETTDDGEKLFA